MDEPPAHDKGDHPASPGNAAPSFEGRKGRAVVLLWPAAGAGFALGLGLSLLAYTGGDPVDHAFIYVASALAGLVVGLVTRSIVGAQFGGVPGYAAAAGYYLGLFASAAWHDALNLLPCALVMMAILSGLFLAGALLALVGSSLWRQR